jgi:hypothetical protein
MLLAGSIRSACHAIDHVAMIVRIGRRHSVLFLLNGHRRVVRRPARLTGQIPFTLDGLREGMGDQAATESFRLMVMPSSASGSVLGR